MSSSKTPTNDSSLSLEAGINITCTDLEFVADDMVVVDCANYSDWESPSFMLLMVNLSNTSNPVI